MKNNSFDNKISFPETFYPAVYSENYTSEFFRINKNVNKSIL